MVNHVCCVPGCYNTLGMRGIYFFTVPTTWERRQKWIEFIGPRVRITHSTRVCSKHFAPGEILACGRLERQAIPTIRASSCITRHESSLKESSSVNLINNGKSATDSADDDCVEMETKQEMDESSILVNVKEELCRVCGSVDDTLVSIFENSSMENTYNVSLVKMLQKYLPLNIQNDDNLPSKICSKCSCMVNQWHELYITCVAADKTFRKMFCQENLKGGCDKPVGRLPEEVVHFTICDESSMEDPVLKMKENVNENCNLTRSGSDGNVSYKGDYFKGKMFCSVEISGKEKIKYPEINRDCFSRISCQYCYDMFDDRRSWRSHNVECKERPTICEKCGKRIPRKYLKMHKFRYHGPKKLCDKCGERFYPRLLFPHILTHHSKTYYCDLCWKIFKTKNGHQTHVIKHQNGEIKTAYKVNTLQKEDKIVFVCPVCDLSFDDKPSLIIHLNKSKGVKCPVCRLKLNNEKLFYRHKCKKLFCQYCGQSYYSKTQLLDHERSHTGETPYKCNNCNLSFKTTGIRNTHQRTKHGYPIYKCTYCPKKYYLPSHLRYHMDIHEGVRYPCPLCDKPFSRPYSLQKHIKLHKMGRI